MDTIAYLVSTAEAAFLADLSDKQIQRVYDEHIVDPPLVRNIDGRRYAMLVAAFAKFYFDSEDFLTPHARKQTIRKLSDRIVKRNDASEIFALHLAHSDVDWRVEIHDQLITLERYVDGALARLERVKRARDLIVEDPETMGGIPVFKGTPLPVDFVASLTGSGLSLSEIQEDYPSLSAEMLDAAGIYLAVNPKRGRPLKNASQRGWTVKDRNVVRPS